MKDRIFISSTYKDLIPHRKALWEVFQSFDINVSGMEKFGASSKKPLETCLKEVEDSTIFIGIIGMRYGSIDSKTKKSFSQLEYEKAFDLNKDILIYIIDANKANIPANSFDPENYLKLKKFKSLLSKNHTIDHFIDEQDLVLKVKNNLDKTLSNAIKIRNYRPLKIEANIVKIHLNNEDWILILGYRFGKLYEIFTSKVEESFYILSHVEEGWVIKTKSEDGMTRFDFQYEDSYGYKTTIEGISRRPSEMTKLVTKLLEKEILLKTIIEIINELDINESELEKAIKKQVIKILRKRELLK